MLAPSVTIATRRSRPPQPAQPSVRGSFDKSEHEQRNVAIDALVLPLQDDVMLALRKALGVSLTSLASLASVGCAASSDPNAAGSEHALASAPAPTASMAKPGLSGIYHNAFSGGFSGREWFQVVRAGGEGRYLLTDIFGGGFSAVLAEDGTITLDGGAGSGVVLSDDAFELRPRLGGRDFVFSAVRVPGTSSDFPLDPLAAPVAGDPALAGRYASVTDEIDPRTGAVVSTGGEELLVAVDGTTFRLTDPAGLYFQGVFLAPNAIAFRVVEPAPTDPRFSSILGSTSDLTQNMLGEARVASADVWDASILLQSRDPLGAQQQKLFHFHATRENAR